MQFSVWCRILLWECVSFTSLRSDMVKKKNSTTFMNDQKQNSDQPRLIATWLSVFPIVYILWFLVGFKFVLEQLAIVNKSQ